MISGADSRVPSGRTAAYVAAGFQTLIGAATFLVAKDAVSRFTPPALVWLRIVLSGALMLSAYLLFGSRRLPSRRDVPYVILLGLLGVTMNQGFFLFGIHRTTPLHAALLYAFTPVMVLVAAAKTLGERPTWLKGAGVALAVAGVALVLTAQGLDLTGGPLRGDFLVLVAVFAWASYTLMGKPILRRYDPFTVITWLFVVGAISVLPAAPWALAGLDPAAPGPRGWLGLGYLCVATSGISFTLWYFALARLEASRLAVFINLQAPITALMAWIFLGTIPAGRVVAGGVLVLAGVTLVQVRLRKRVAGRAERLTA
jgi:drug/metabolite transporter (DMT)-like permease